MVRAGADGAGGVPGQAVPGANNVLNGAERRKMQEQGVWPVEPRPVIWCGRWADGLESLSKE